MKSHKNQPMANNQQSFNKGSNDRFSQGQNKPYYQGGNASSSHGGNSHTGNAHGSATSGKPDLKVVNNPSFGNAGKSQTSTSSNTGGKFKKAK